MSYAITDTARVWIENRDAVDGLLAIGEWGYAQDCQTDAEVARARVEEDLARLFAAGATR